MQLHTMQAWILDIVVPDYTRTCQALGLEVGAQKAIVKIDVYTVHICAELRLWMNEKHPH